MATTQSFRVFGKTSDTDVKRVRCQHIDGMDVVFWEDVEQIFPEVSYVENGGVAISFMRHPDYSRMKPFRIEHHPDVVLDVVLSTTVERDSMIVAPRPSLVSTLSEASISDHTVENLQVHPPLISTTTNETNVNTLSGALLSSLSSGTKTSSKLSLKQVVALAQRRALESEIEQRVIRSMSSQGQIQIRDSSSGYTSVVQAIKEGQAEQKELFLTCFQELQSEIAKNTELTLRMVEMQEELKRLQIQALDRLALLHKQVQAVLTQTYELHEYPIPRLFVVLPQDQSRWDYLNPFANKFRLYFLCECGEHTKSNNSKIPHHIHLAKHKGYEITRPSEFFEQYGSYVLTILRMLKFGISVAGVVVPAVSHLFPSDAIDQVTKDLKSLKGHVGTGMDKVINCIEKASRDEGSSIDEFMDPMENNEALEGADLRKLDTFLKNKDENKVLGNLYRTVTSEGHVKWVCIDHYRENYQSKTVQSLRDIVASLGGSFDENTGRVKVTLPSKVQASQFYSALEKAKSVYELSFRFGWMPAYSDFKDLRDTLYKTNVGVLELDNLGSTDSVGDVLNRNRQYNPILDIMRHSSIKSMTSPFTKDFFTRSTLFSRNDDFSNLRNFSTSPIHQELPYIGHILSKAPNLTTLTLAMEIDIWVDTFNAIVEYQTYPIAFKHWNSELSLHIPTPATESRGSKRTLKDKDEFFRIHGQGIEQWVDYYPEATEMEAIVQGTQNGSRLKTFVLERGTDLGEERIKSLASIVAHSELHTLKLQLRGEEGRIRILESIPWTHIRELSIRLDRTGQLTSVTKALLGGMEKVASERLELEFFHLYSGSGEISVDEQNLLRSFISSMAFRRLRLNIPLDPGQAVELMRLVDMSRLQKLWLSMQGSDSSDVQKILDSLQHATEIQTMLLEYADITEDQREMIKAKGITLEYWEQ